MTIAFINLPQEILIEIMCWLDPVDVVRLGTTCRYMRSVSYEPVYWKKAYEVEFRDIEHDPNRSPFERFATERRHPTLTTVARVYALMARFLEPEKDAVPTPSYGRFPSDDAGKRSEAFVRALLEMPDTTGGFQVYADGESLRIRDPDEFLCNVCWLRMPSRGYDNAEFLYFLDRRNRMGDLFPRTMFIAKIGRRFVPSKRSWPKEIWRVLTRREPKWDVVEMFLPSDYNGATHIALQSYPLETRKCAPWLERRPTKQIRSQL